MELVLVQVTSQDSIGFYQYNSVPLTIVPLFIVEARGLFLIDLRKLEFLKSYSPFELLHIFRVVLTP